MSICSILVLRGVTACSGIMFPPGGTSEGKSQPIQEQKRAGREREAEDRPCCPSEKMFEYDENRSTKRQRERQRARAGKPGRVRAPF